jgi:hypothetical protein
VSLPELDNQKGSAAIAKTTRGQSLKVKGNLGSVNLSPNGKIKISDVLYVPRITKTILSVDAIAHNSQTFHYFKIFTAHVENMLSKKLILLS